MTRTRLHVRGAVQGVGFRPFIHRLASERALAGWVCNHPDGVLAELQGPASAIHTLLSALTREAPPAARIDTVDTEPCAPDPAAAGFHIVASVESTPAQTQPPVLPPDLATCAACLAEVADPHARRHRYPFTSCTACGPRYSIALALPYDRARTSMRDFALCPACAREYDDPSDRRHHAQPLACPACGPVLRLEEPTGAVLARADDALRATAAALRAGAIVAIAGLGGYQLVCDAGDDAAVQRLRIRKRRPDKPFALLLTPTQLDACCQVSPAERALLTSPRAPIVLLQRRADATLALAPAVAPGQPRLGVMLPASALHHLLLADGGRPLVCTSGNLGDEPMATRCDDARTRLGAIADLLLHHDRAIVRPVDDSVVRVDPRGPTLLRRARGYAPTGHRIAPAVAPPAPPILALGGHQKGTLTLLVDGVALVSQHLGDLGSLEGADLLARAAADLLAFQQVRPALVACDLHPDYASTRLAEALTAQHGARLVRVQHHHAHALACAADRDLAGSFLALTWDGAGLGDDGTVWGGEALVIEPSGFRRVGRLRRFALPGGDAASREPRRSALGLAWACLGDDPPAELSTCFTPAELATLARARDAGLAMPMTSSIGRLFDACATLIGVRQQRGYEGQAATMLEHLAAAHAEAPLAVPAWPLTPLGDLLEADPAPLIRALLTARRAAGAPGALALALHDALAVLAVAFARHAALPDVVLSGGCFQNALLTARVTSALEAAGHRVHSHAAFPANDGALSLGQAVTAARAHATATAGVA